jgi:hypothetical protein
MVKERAVLANKPFVFKGVIGEKSENVFVGMKGDDGGREA